jgi:membrane fusion protein, copper/silver efflux system
MKTRSTLSVVAVVIAALAATGWFAYQAGMSGGMRMAGAPSSSMAAPASDPATWSVAQGEAATRRHIEQGLKAGAADPATGREILYYQDPMVPGKRFDAPGKSPFMNMMLVPVYGGGGGAAADAGSVSVSPRMQQNLGLATALVTEGTLAPSLIAIGAIAWNERDQAVLAARAAGVVEKLHARAQFDRVAAGAPVAELFVPDWVAVQEEFLALRRSPSKDVAALADAARQRMLLAGMVEAQIAEVEASGRVQPRLVLRAPIDGVIAEVMVREGMAVSAGATLLRITGTGTVWAQAEVPESQAALLKVGTPVRASTPARPGLSFAGRVQALLPEVNPATRTITARVEFGNRGMHLVPGMTVQMSFADLKAEKVLLVPSSAVIQTGQRAVVMLAEDGGRFRPVEVESGVESAGQTAIRKGLAAGQRVVVSSQFLIDSEASLKAVETRLNRAEPAASGVKP